MNLWRALSAGHLAKSNPQTINQNPAQFRARLAAWFRVAGRDLPWRNTRDPYAILVSEIMLQQTQVATVLPYYTRWLARFPDFFSLAAADENAVLSLWQGLGYYSRARNLYQAARRVTSDHSGKLPPDIAILRALPGIGRYTAGAIASFAFDLPEPIVDANIARVLARLMDLHLPVDTPAGQRELWAAATVLVPKKGARIFNSALMELGALLCTPRLPKCPQCPVRNDCKAFAAGTVALLPQKKTRRKQVALVENCAWIVHAGRILLEYQRGSRWSGMWKLPALSATPDQPPLHTLEYPFTHHRVALSIFQKRSPRILRESLAWHAWDVLDSIPIPSPHRRAIEHIHRAQVPG